ncbi:hypothetical protein CRYUN_Cryun34aG0079000 [Craigia yunnanensis]
MNLKQILKELLEHSKYSEKAETSLFFWLHVSTFHGIVSIKTVVFSFGVLLLEIVSGKKNNCCYHLDRQLNLIGYAWQLWNEGRGLVLIDPILDESCNQNEALRCTHVGLLCVHDHTIDRLTMQDDVSMLLNETVQLPAPAFFIYAAEEEQDIAEIKSNNCSINCVSLSDGSKIICGSIYGFNYCLEKIMK